MGTDRVRTGTPDLAALARLLADDTRASFCLALLDGRAWTAAELARHSGVAASTATGHLSQLVAGGLLAQERQGRNALREHLGLLVG
jgi:DNA-binding transcriptional ArsR family regulator